MSILHAIDFEGTRATGVMEYGLVTVIRGKIAETRAAECPRNFNEHIDVFMKLRRCGAFVGPNASVEDGLLRHDAPSPGFVGKYSNSSEGVATWGPWIDTRMLYRTFHGNLLDYSISGLEEKFGFEGQLLVLAEKICPAHKLGYHNAMFDALATCILVKKFAAELQKNGAKQSDGLLLEYSRPVNGAERP
jgi:DNA polymerase-3 subunit epsilon